jgi:hypothetical protein
VPVFGVLRLVRLIEYEMVYLRVMIAYLLYRKGTPEERRAEDLMRRLQEAQVEAELMDADSPRGSQFAQNYDIMGRPAVVLVRGDGSVSQIWQGAESMPSPSDVAYLAHQ